MPSDAAIVRSSLELARNLNLEVVAEGVETQAVWDQLTDLGCSSAQGYFLSRPLPPDDFAALARRARGVTGVRRPGLIDRDTWLLQRAADGVQVSAWVSTATRSFRGSSTSHAA